MKNVIKTTRTRPLKSVVMGSQWKEKQSRQMKSGKVQRGAERNIKRTWEV